MHSKVSWPSTLRTPALGGSDGYGSPVPTPVPKQLSLWPSRRDGNHSFENQTGTHHSLATQLLITKAILLALPLSAKQEECTGRACHPAGADRELFLPPGIFHLAGDNFPGLQVPTPGLWETWVHSSGEPDFSVLSLLLLSGISAFTLSTMQKELKLKYKHTKHTFFSCSFVRANMSHHFCWVYSKVLRLQGLACSVLNQRKHFQPRGSGPRMGIWNIFNGAALVFTKGKNKITMWSWINYLTYRDIHFLKFQIIFSCISNYYVDC